MKERKSDAKSHALRLPKMYFNIGMVMLVLGSLFGVTVGMLPTSNSGNDMLFVSIFAYVFAFIGLIPVVCYINWEIKIHDDKLVFRNFLRRRHMYLMDDLNYDRRISKTYVYAENKRVFIITVLSDHYEDIFKKIKPRIYNEISMGTIKGNTISRNFGFTFVILGLVFLVLFFTGLSFSENTTDIVINCILLVVGLIVLGMGIFFMNLRYVWKILLDDTKVKITNTLGLKKTYKKEFLSYQMTNHGYHVFFNDKRIFYFNENLTEEPKLIHALKKR